MPAEGLKELCEVYKALYKQHTGEDFPQDPMKQLEKAVEAVFKSWMTNKAVKYREIEGIRGLLGTAVNCQSMVYGNMGDDSGTGVAFTRNPNTGEDKFFGEFLVNAQGEDVVAGIRTPQPTEEMSKWNAGVYEELMVIKDKLEKHYKDMQDIEFTIEKGTLFMLQTRNGKRTGMAAVKLAVDMVQRRPDRREDGCVAGAGWRFDSVAAAQLSNRSLGEGRQNCQGLAGLPRCRGW